MTNEDDRMLEDNIELLGPTLVAERGRKSTENLLNKMEPLPLCAICPAARWYKLADDLIECFCVEYRGIMYERYNKVAVVECDARADVLNARKPD